MTHQQQVRKRKILGTGPSKNKHVCSVTFDVKARPLASYPSRSLHTSRLLLVATHLQLDVDVVFGSDPLPGALEVDLDGGRRATRERHRAVLDDVVEVVGLLQEDGHTLLVARLSRPRRVRLYDRLCRGHRI